MPGRLPLETDFPGVSLTITPPPSSQQAVNVLILLHGLGDSNLPFKSLGQQLSLPETVCLSLRAPTPMPFELGGFHWGDDIVLDQGTGDMDFDTGFKKSTQLIVDRVIQPLVDKCKYSSQEILLFGFRQGGMAALAAAASMPPADELNGIVSVGGPLPVGSKTSSTKSRIPVLVLGGSSQTLISDEAVSGMKSVFQFVEHKRWRRNGDSMPRDRDEMLPIMQFFARRLKSQQGVPEGSVEIL